MIPRVAQGGRSFKGACAYYLQDKNRQSSDRVAWTHTQNLLTDDPQKAWLMMAYTAKAQYRLKEASGQSRSGRRLEKPVFSFSLSWHPNQTPHKQHILATALKAVDILGLSEHEILLAAHNDTDHKHVHVVINRVHPITGMAGDVRNSKRKLSDFALEYERANGNVYCSQREINFQQRKLGEKTIYENSIVKEAWTNSSNGKELISYLEQHGYNLALGHKRLVVVDPYGKAHNPTRMIEGVRVRDIRVKLSDLNEKEIPKLEAVITDRLKGAASSQAPSLREIRKEHEKEIQKLKYKHRDQLKRSKKELSRCFELKQIQAGLNELKRRANKRSWLHRILGIARRSRLQYQDALIEYQTLSTEYKSKLKSIRMQHESELKSIQERHRHELLENRNATKKKIKTKPLRKFSRSCRPIEFEQTTREVRSTTDYYR